MSAERLILDRMCKHVHTDGHRIRAPRWLGAPWSQALKAEAKPTLRSREEVVATFEGK